jgi:hypothetical protein
MYLGKIVEIATAHDLYTCRSPGESLDSRPDGRSLSIDLVCDTPGNISPVRAHGSADDDADWVADALVMSAD